MITLEDLKNTWAELDQKLDRNWKLNLELIRRTNLDKARKKIRSLIWVNALTLTFYLVATVLFVSFTIANLASIPLMVTGIVFGLWTLLICIAAVHEFELISKLDYSAPIPELQKKLSKIKLVIIRYLRLGVWIFPLYFGFIILFFKLLFGIDIVTHGDQNWIIGNLIFSVVVFVPLALWAHKKLSPVNAEKKWMNKLLRGNGSQITDALVLLDEIEEFEE